MSFSDHDSDYIYELTLLSGWVAIETLSCGVNIYSRASYKKSWGFWLTGLNAVLKLLSSHKFMYLALWKVTNAFIKCVDSDAHGKEWLLKNYPSPVELGFRI